MECARSGRGIPESHIGRGNCRDFAVSRWHPPCLRFSCMDQLRLAIRTLFRAPGFTAAAVLVLAIGVGGSTAVFSVLRSVVLRPLGLPHPEQLVRLYERPAGTEARWSFSGPDYFDVSREG